MRKRKYSLVLLGALLVSVAIHAVGLVVPEVFWRGLADEPASASVRVVLPHLVAPEEKGNVGGKRPLKQRRSAAAQTETLPVPGESLMAAESAWLAADGSAVLTSDLGAEAAEPKLEGPAASAASEVRVRPDFPSTARIEYAVFMGAMGGLVGRATQTWEMQAGQYRITSIMETVGFTAFLRAVRVETESQGLLTPTGLAPVLFTSRRVGRAVEERVEFDYAAQVLRYANGEQQVLPEGVQDMLSLNYQLAWLTQSAEVSMTTGRKLGRYVLTFLGEEALETPLGVLRTVHFRTVGETSTEVWLAMEKYGLPVKVVHVDKRGDRFEQMVSQMVLTP